MIGDDLRMKDARESGWKVLGGVVFVLVVLGLFLATIIWGRDGEDPLGTILRWLVR